MAARNAFHDAARREIDMAAKAPGREVNFFEQNIVWLYGDDLDGMTAFSSARSGWRRYWTRGAGASSGSALPASSASATARTDREGPGA